MTTELTLLLALTVFMVMGVLFSERGPQRVFFNSAPRLAARVESQLATGRGFLVDGHVLQWQETAIPRVGGSK